MIANTPQRNIQYNTNKFDQFQQFNQKCVCQICTCGKHHCPQKHTKFIAQTTNHHDYKPYQITATKQQPCRYEFQQRHYDPEALKTSYKKDYPTYKIQPHQNVPIRYELPKNNKPFYDQTQYKKNYKPYEVTVQRPQTCTGIQYPRNKAKFTGTTTYNAEFSPKPLERSRIPEKSPNYYDRKKTKFEGQTVYNSQFKPHQIEVVKPHVCQHDLYGQTRKNKFLGESRYNQEFKAYKIQKPCTCPINLMPPQPRQCSPGKNHLNYSAEKHRWQ